MAVHSLLCLLALCAYSRASVFDPYLDSWAPFVVDEFQSDDVESMTVVELPVSSENAGKPKPDAHVLPKVLSKTINVTLWYPELSKSFTKDDQGYPKYTGDQSAELCPAELRFKCAKCHGGCDGSRGEASDVRPCKNHDVNPSNSCYPVPRQKGEIGMPTVKMAPTTRKRILERAAAWLGSGYGYKWKKFVTRRPTMTLEGCGSDDDNTQCPRYRYMLDCDGFVKMAWRTPGKSGFQSWADPIACKDMLPGDAVVHYSKSHHFKHIQLFRKWNGPKTETGSRPWQLWQMGGGGGKVNQTNGQFHPQNETSKTIQCIRRKQLK